MSQPTMKRVVSRWPIVAVSLNDVIGSGVYLLPAAATALLGPASVWAVAAAGLAVLLVVLCFAEAATHFDEPGSAYLYAKTAFGNAVGFQVGWMAWITRVAAEASLAAGFAQALAFLWPAADEGLGRVFVVGGAIIGLYLINLVGVQMGTGASVVLTIAKLVPLAVFIVVGAASFSWERMIGQEATGEGTLGAAVLLLLYAYAGFENTAAAAGEFKNPKRDVPFALLTQIALVTSVYVLVQAVALGTLDSLATSQSPIAEASRLLLGPAGGLLLTVGAAISILGTTANSVFAGPRYLFALAKDGYFPAPLGRVHPRFRTPAAALGLQTLIALPLALTGSFVHLATLSVVARLATYLSTAAAVPVLRRKMPTPAEGSFRLPGGPLIPIAACVMGLIFAASATVQNLLAAAAALVVGAVIYLLNARHRTSHSG